jgi:photosystem II stability/assembly factor-like uncharacterized protein
VVFLDNQNGWIIGSSGTILYTSDGGINWLPQNSGTSFALTDISFVNLNNGWVVGRSFSGSNFEGIILHTSNGGIDWIDQTPGQISGLSSVSFVDSLTGWVAGGGGSLIDYGLILHTSNGGQNWTTQRQHPDLEIFDIQFVDPEYGWVSGYDPQTNAPIIHTTDGGLTWSGQYGGGGYDIHFIDRSNGWAVWLFGKIYHTSNGGQTWHQQNSFTNQGLEKLDFVNNNEGWIIGDWGTILHTSNGGISEIEILPRSPVVTESFLLSPNYPNPFNASTVIFIDILIPYGKSNLSIYDITGRKLLTLYEGILPKGKHKFSWRGENNRSNEVSSGIYIFNAQVKFMFPFW